MGSDPLSCFKEASYLKAVLFGVVILFVSLGFFFFETLAGTAPLWLVVVKCVIFFQQPVHFRDSYSFTNTAKKLHWTVFCLPALLSVWLLRSSSSHCASHSISWEVYVLLFILPLQFQILLQPSVRRNDSSRTNVILLALAKNSICKPFHLIQAFTFFKRDYSWPVTPHKTWMSLVYYCFPVEWVTNTEHLTVMPELL